MKQQQAMVEFNVYIGDSTSPIQGVSEVKLPSLQAIKTELNPSGAAGKVNVALIGQYDALTCTITADIAAKEAIIAALQNSVDITVRGAVQVHNTATGVHDIERRSYILRGSLSSLDLGTVKKGEVMGNAIEFEASYLKVFVNGADVLELDKFNNICTIDGEDKLAAVRDAI